MLSPSLLAERIKMLCAANGISAATLLTECGINKNGLFTMENKGSYPRLEKIQIIAERLGFSVSELISDEDLGSPEAKKVAEIVSGLSEEAIEISYAFEKLDQVGRRVIWGKVYEEQRRMTVDQENKEGNEPRAV